MKDYSTPVVEKIIFDYTIQTGSSGCYKQVTNIEYTAGVCDDSSTPNEKWVRDEDPNW